MGEKKILLLLVILIIASFLRLYHITSIPPGLYPDEAMNGNNALEALRMHDWKVFYPENNGREGLFINIQSLFLKFFGVNEPWVLRLPSAIFGILTVLGIYFLAAELFSAETGLLAAFLLATNFWHINFSRISFRAIMAPFILTWAAYFLLRGFKELTRGGKSYRAAAWHILGGIIYGLGFYTYIAYRISPLLILLVFVYFWHKSKQEGWQKHFLLFTSYFLIFAFLVALPIGVYFLHNSGDFFGRTAQISIFRDHFPLKDLFWNTAKTLGMFNFMGDWNWRHNIAGAPELYWPVGILFIIGILAAFNGFRKNFRLSGNFSLYFVFTWLVLALLPVVVSNEGIPHALRSILLLPPAIILAASGGVRLYGKISPLISKKMLLAACSIFFIAVTFAAYVNYFQIWAKNPNVYDAFSGNSVELGKQLNDIPREVPKYVIVQAVGVSVRGIPMPAQTVMFITDTLSPENQKAKNIFYVISGEEAKLPSGALKFYIP